MDRSSGKLSVARIVSIDLVRQGLLQYGAAAVCIDAWLPSDPDGNSEVSRATALMLQVQQEVQDYLPEDLQRLQWLHSDAVSLSSGPKI